MNVFMIIILVLIFFIILHNSKYIKFNKIYRNMLKTIKIFVDDELINNKKNKKNNKKSKIGRAHV